MATRHYIVDVWVDDDLVTEDQLDTKLGEVVNELKQQDSSISYDLVDMGLEDE